MFSVTKEAMTVMTIAQRDALVRLANDAVDHIGVQKGGFDLPEGYLAFRQKYADHSSPIYGGIAPNGDVST